MNEHKWVAETELMIECAGRFSRCRVWLRGIGCAMLLATVAAAQEPTADELFQKGRDALFQGEYPVAIELLQKAVAADAEGTQTGYRLYLAKAYRYAGQTNEAEPLLRQILAVSPDHVEAGRSLAEIHAGQKKWQEVLEVLDRPLHTRSGFGVNRFVTHR